VQEGLVRSLLPVRQLLPGQLLQPLAYAAPRPYSAKSVSGAGGAEAMGLEPEIRVTVTLAIYQLCERLSSACA
jgi:hypothetical protein